MRQLQNTQKFVLCFLLLRSFADLTVLVKDHSIHVPFHSYSQSQSSMQQMSTLVTRFKRRTLFNEKENAKKKE